uniref:Thioredoxin n=1 Tax=Gallus gallus TaxID=9031 RepID=A0A8V0XP99_CHICK
MKSSYSNAQSRSAFHETRPSGAVMRPTNLQSCALTSPDAQIAPSEFRCSHGSSEHQALVCPGPPPCYRDTRHEEQADFEAELKAAGEKLVVVDFSATWCGPCKMIKPFFHSLCDKFGDVVFIEIDVDDAQDVATHCDVKCMPTFQFYKNGKKVQEFSGANKEKLEETIKSLV